MINIYCVNFLTEIITVPQTNFLVHDQQFCPNQILLKVSVLSNLENVSEIKYDT